MKDSYYKELQLSQKEMKRYTRLNPKLIQGVIILTALFILCGASSSSAANLDASSLSYQGAFKIPGFSWGAGRSISYNPNGNGGAGSLFVTRNDEGASTLKYDPPSFWQHHVQEITIPTPVNSKVWDELPAPSIGNGPTAIAKAAPSGGGEGIDELGGVLYDANHNVLYWSGYYYYNVTDGEYPSIGYMDPDFTNQQGLWFLGPQINDSPNHNKTGKYMILAPESWADTHTNGRYLLAGRTRGGGTLTSMGPSLYAIDPNPTSPPPNGSRLNFSRLMEYGTNWPGYGWGNGVVYDTPAIGKTIENFSPLDRARSGVWIDAGTEGRAILFVGVKTSNKWCYKPGCPANECGQSNNWTLYENGEQDIKHAAFWWYSIDDLEAVAAGSLAHDDIQPYSMAVPSGFVWNNSQCNANGFGGVTYDAASGRLFLVEIDAHERGGNPYSVVHVFKVGGGGDPDVKAPMSLRLAQ